MSKCWHIYPHDPDRIAALGHAAGIPAVVAQLLIGRGLTDPQAVGDFSSQALGLARPRSVPGCRAAAEARRGPCRGAADCRLRRLRRYGMTGAAILGVPAPAGADVRYYIPHRIDEGYGLNGEAIRKLAAEGVEVLVTVDCGIGSRTEAALARELGVELIITDHHEPGGVLPAAAAIVHPRLPPCAPGRPYPFGDLSGSGVALKVAWAVCQQASGSKRAAPPMREFSLQAVGLAALGTVADVVPLVGENRVLVHHGLESLAKAPNLGLATLMEVAKVAPRNSADGKLRLAAEDVGFSDRPATERGRTPRASPNWRSNCWSPTGPSGRASLACTSTDSTAPGRPWSAASTSRPPSRPASCFDPAADAALVLADHDWHPGVIGIVASRLVERFHRPVVMISWDNAGQRPGIGSARSVPGFNLHAVLADCGEFWWPTAAMRRRPG